jgi:hypothetical protein
LFVDREGRVRAVVMKDSSRSRRRASSRVAHRQDLHDGGEDEQHAVVLEALIPTTAEPFRTVVSPVSSAASWAAGAPERDEIGVDHGACVFRTLPDARSA